MNKKEEIELLAKEVYKLLVEGTKSFGLSKVKGEPSDSSARAIHEFRLINLITQVRKMGVRKFYSMPLNIRMMHTRNDWVQDAMILMFKCLEDYDPQRGHFNNYVKFIVKRRLVDIEKKLLAIERKQENKNPTEDRGIEEQSDRNISEEDRSILRSILHDCIEELHPEAMTILHDHEVAKISFTKLFDEFKNSSALKKSKSVRSFQRNYNKDIFQPLYDCVQKKLNDNIKNEV